MRKSHPYHMKAGAVDNSTPTLTSKPGEESGLLSKHFREDVRQAYARFERGDRLSDDEVVLLLKTMDDAEALLSIPLFAVARRVVALDRARLQAILEARQLAAHG